MDERRMLELAALAYWGAEIDDVCSIRWLEDEQAIGYTHGDNQDHNGADQEFVWNPRESDGDALRLAAKLYLWEAVRLAHREVSDAVDIYAATRLAIVRAAAAIGQQMKEQT